jgi:hypothetical protein
MTYGQVPTGRQQLEARIVRRAWKDPAFRELLLRDPRAAVGDELGAEIPAGLRIEVVEERSDLLCIVLPVDISEIGMDAVWAMTGVRPGAAAPRPE